MNEIVFPLPDKNGSVTSTQYKKRDKNVHMVTEQCFHNYDITVQRTKGQY